MPSLTGYKYGNLVNATGLELIIKSDLGVSWCWWLTEGVAYELPSWPVNRTDEIEREKHARAVALVAHIDELSRDLVKLNESMHWTLTVWPAKHRVEIHPGNFTELGPKGWSAPAV